MQSNLAGAKSEAAYQRVKDAVREAEIAGERGEPLSEDAEQFAAAFDGMWMNGRPVVNPIRRAHEQGRQRTSSATESRTAFPFGAD